MRSIQFGASVGLPVIRGMDGPRVGVLSDGLAIQDASMVSSDHAVAAEPLLACQIELLRARLPWPTAPAKPPEPSN